MTKLLLYVKKFTVFSYSCLILIFVVAISDWERLMLNFTQFNSNVDYHEEFYSSVYCRGNNHTDRICKFRNLCFNPSTDVFMFFHGANSDVIGVPEDRFSPALVDFSSVYDHNTQYFNYIDLPGSAFLNFTARLVGGTAVLFKRFNPENLMHVFHDDLIPAYVTLKENFLIDDKNDVFFVFADGRDPGPYADLYGTFLKKEPFYLSSASEVICFDKAVIGLNKHSLWYHYGFKKPQGPLNKDMNLISPMLAHFRSYFKKQFSLQEKAVKDNALLLTRGHNRKILNYKELAKVLEVNSNLKSQTASLEEYSVIEVIEKIMSSKIVIGIHGSLLILCLFLPPNSHIIELFPYGIDSNICTPYRTLAKIPSLKLTYHSWENKIEKNSIPHPEYPADHGGILHLPIHVQDHIRKSPVKPFLCCYNPEWLYRIYQDTVVDLNTFTSIIKNAIHNDERVIRDMTTGTKLYPSEVQNLSCQLNSENLIHISWERPWNVNFMNATVIEYELWYQDNDEDDIKAFIMRKTFFNLKNISNIYVWIRCHVDGNIGPFNTNPLVCQK